MLVLCHRHAPLLSPSKRWYFFRTVGPIRLMDSPHFFMLFFHSFFQSYSMSCNLSASTSCLNALQHKLQLIAVDQHSISNGGCHHTRIQRPNAIIQSHKLSNVSGSGSILSEQRPNQISRLMSLLYPHKICFRFICFLILMQLIS